MQDTYGQIYEQLYFYHWWWRARESILLKELSRLSTPSSAQVLDVGCGNGLFLKPLSRWGQVTGIEVDQSLITEDGPFRDRIFHEPVGHERYQAMRFDLITALDVVEHIEQDRVFTQQLMAMLNPGGYLVVTVPAFQCLWDHHDEINHHYRRYRLKDLGELLRPLGEVQLLRYLFPSLFLPKYAVAKLNRVRKQAVEQAAVPPRWVTTVASTWLKAEDAVARRLGVPWGSSALAVVRKGV